MIVSCGQNHETYLKKVSLDTLAPSPPMGWNSWLTYGTDVREDEIKAIADYMAANLKQYGWEYVVIDLGWYSKEIAQGMEYYKARPHQIIDEYGRLIPDTIKFPSAASGKGLKPVADYIHNKGLKIGIHVMRGIPYSAAEKHTPVLHTNFFADDITLYDEGCAWYDGMRKVDMNHPAGQAYYNSIVELYASWGIDFIKADDMQVWPYHTKEVEGMHNAIETIGRPMILSLSPGGPPPQDRNHPIRFSNMYRLTGDLWDTWEAVYEHFEVCKQYEFYQKPNHWGDCDLMPVGKINLRGENGKGERISRLSYNEQKTLVTLWSIFRSPLFLSNNIVQTDSLLLSLLTNKEVIEVDQHSTNNRQLFSKDSTVAWIADGMNENSAAKYIALFNTGIKTRDVSVDFEQLKISGEIIVRDLWVKKDIGKLKEIKASIGSHGAVLYKLLILN